MFYVYVTLHHNSSVHIITHSKNFGVPVQWTGDVIHQTRNVFMGRTYDKGKWSSTLYTAREWMGDIQFHS